MPIHLSFAREYLCNHLSVFSSPKENEKELVNMPFINKERMIEVAIDLFSAKGYKGTSIRDIARAMGVSISNICHYFDNKEGLWLAI